MASDSADQLASWLVHANARYTRPAAFMKRIRYSKYVPDPAGEMSMEDLLSALADFLLQSGFHNYMYDPPFRTASKLSTICGKPSNKRCAVAIC